uniref:Uncharacterized protein n=1 Tax=uncultured organism Bio4 TaxID=460931 RepID=B2BKA8_9ZZZZ|nr:unknown [uncultured organism Bio4]
MNLGEPLPLNVFQLVLSSVDTLLHSCVHAHTPAAKDSRFRTDRLSFALAPTPQMGPSSIRMSLCGQGGQKERTGLFFSPISFPDPSKRVVKIVVWTNFWPERAESGSGPWV